MKKKKSSIGCLFWVALILLVLVIFLFNKKTINNVIESTGFLTFLSKDKTEETTPEVDRKDLEPSGQEDDKEQEKKPVEIVEAEPEKEEKEGREEMEPAAKEAPDKEVTEKEAPKTEGKSVRNARLYFIDVDENGAIRLKAVVRQVYFEDSPLTQTIKALLGGLLPSELNQELLTLIPEDTRLLSATVNDGTAYLNFNEDFKFNTLGTEGLRAQLKQIVYTATEFSTVKNVQILIENKKHDYLASEGVFIGGPLNRNSF